MPLSEVTNTAGDIINASPTKSQPIVNSADPPASKVARRDTVSAPLLRFVRLSANAFAPERGSAQAAGLDLRSAHDDVVPARGKALIKTDLQIELPEGCYGRVAPRSGLSWKHHIDVAAGVIDRDYRGNVGVVLFNHSDQQLNVTRGDRIAQLILEKIFYPQLEEVSQLSDTDRGQGGFGSTGTN